MANSEAQRRNRCQRVIDAGVEIDATVPHPVPLIGAFVPSSSFLSTIKGGGMSDAPRNPPYYGT